MPLFHLCWFCCPQPGLEELTLVSHFMCCYMTVLLSVVLVGQENADQKAHNLTNMSLQVHIRGKRGKGDRQNKPLSIS